ncbi:lysozyme-like isoform X2 [Bacillus rossius redtenbacheri]|uniref:lysozyme-like isoform X2 n=1 Tax=Bacillus rossius redtenbacheri TaxID=93214 RepID=UPI002FDD1DCE
MGRRPLPASPPLLLLLLLSACAVGAGVFISNLDSVCVRCLCEAASNCNETVGCHKGYCGPFFISRNYWLDAGGRPLPGDDPDRSEAYQDCATDYNCAVRTLEFYMEKHGQDCNGDGVTDCDDYAFVHYNGGYDCGKSLKGTSFYSRYQRCRPAKFQD